MYKENYPSKLLADAVDAINMLPGVGKRSALRLALHLLRQPQENVHHFTSAINRLRDDVRYCRVCRMISDDDVCSICSDLSRDRNTVCVVESVRDVMSIENTGQYHGLYHVLGGIISPINGVGPSDLTIRELVDRVAAGCCCSPGSPAGTAPLPEGGMEVILYRQIEKYGVKVSSLARGLGFGDDLEYADELTLGRSIVNRQIFRP